MIDNKSDEVDIPPKVERLKMLLNIICNAHNAILRSEALKKAPGWYNSKTMHNDLMRLVELKLICTDRSVSSRKTLFSASARGHAAIMNNFVDMCYLYPKISALRSIKAPSIKTIAEVANVKSTNDIMNHLLRITKPRVDSWRI